MELKGPTSFELLKQINKIRRDPVNYLDWAAKTYGHQVHFKAGTVDAFFVNHPDVVRLILRDQHSRFNKDTVQYNALAHITGKGLLTNSGPGWFQQRRILQPAFSKQRLNHIEPYAVRATQALINRWKKLPPEKRVIDVDREMMELSLEILGLALFGSDLHKQLSILVDAVLSALDFIMSGARNVVQAPLFVPTKANRHFKQAVKTLDAAVETMLAERKRLGLGDDVLSDLLRAQAEHGEAEISFRQMRDEVITLLIAGHETVATALTWTWYLLAKHTGERAILLNEVDTTLNGVLPDLDRIQNMPYTLQVFQESLRLYPPAWLITRKAVEEINGSDLTLPKNALVIISPYTMHRHPEYWKNPEQFDPNRFAPAVIQKQHKFAFIPFGAGPALCIGKNFALIEAHLVISMISQYFLLDLENNNEVKMDALVTLRPQGGLHLRLTERK